MILVCAGDIALEASAVVAGIDGSFRSGPLQGRTVNIKWYLKREGLLDTSESPRLDYYLVLAGPPSAAASSRGAIRPWCIEAVFLFDARQLRAEQIKRGVKRGIASSVVKRQWKLPRSFQRPVIPSWRSRRTRPKCSSSFVCDRPTYRRPNALAARTAAERLIHG
jgi:hypothetical protein